MSKRVKLFDLSESVQAVVIKDESTTGKPCLSVNFYTESDGLYFHFSFESEYETEELRDKNFCDDHTEQLIRIYNQIIEQTEGIQLSTIKNNNQNLKP